MSSVTIVIVSWNVREQLVQCLSSIRKTSSKSNVKIYTVVVDNASTDGTVDAVKNEFTEVELIANKENFGFGKACNQGAKHRQTDYLLFLNPDTELIADSLEDMINFMDDQPFVGLLGPRIENDDGSLQPSARRFPTLVSAIMVLLKLQRLFPSSLPMRRYMMTGFKHETLRRVDQLMGACLLVRTKLFTELGGFDERFFIWFEEVDLCKRITETSNIIFFYPWATIKHQKSRSFAKRSILWRQWHFSKSCRAYFWKNHNVASALLVSVASYLSLLPALVAEALAMLGAKIKTDVDKKN